METTWEYLLMRHMRWLLVAALPGLAAVAPVVAEESKAWLGAQIGPVPKPMDAHFGLKGRGAMVLNVAKDSPADRAGLERFDVILKFGQDDVVTVDQFIDRVRRSAPGTTVVLRVLHEAKEKDVEVTLVGPPDAGKPPYKYEPLPDAFLDDRFDVRGRIFRKTPGGWRLEDLGEFEDFPRLFDEIMPKFRHKQWEYWLDDDRKPIRRFHAHVSRDGQVIDIQGSEDGPITVQRSGSKEGNPTTTVYQSLDELRKSDPEAYTIYIEATERSPGWRGIDGPLPPPGKKEPRHRDMAERYRQWLKDLADRLPGLDRQRLSDLLDEMRREWGPELDAARKQLADLEKRIEERVARLRRSESPASAPDASGQGASEPATRFEVTPDGKVTVHLRDGENALTLHFDDVGQLKAKRPDLYTTYEALEKKRQPAGR